MSIEIGSKLEGAADTILALKAVDPNMYKEFRKRLSSVGKFVSGMAANSAPVRGGTMKRGYKARMRNRGRVSLVTITNTTRQGAILEFAGSVSRGKTPQGQSLIRGLDQNYGKPGRFLWAAYDFLEPWIEDEFDKAAAQAEVDLQAALDGAGD